MRLFAFVFIELTCFSSLQLSVDGFAVDKMAAEVKVRALHRTAHLLYKVFKWRGECVLIHKYKSLHLILFGTEFEMGTELCEGGTFTTRGQKTSQQPLSNTVLKYRLHNKLWYYKSKI